MSGPRRANGEKHTPEGGGPRQVQEKKLPPKFTLHPRMRVD